MPLTPGSSRSIISSNIKEMIASGRPQNVAVAASLSNARRGRVKKEKPESPAAERAESPKKERGELKAGTEARGRQMPNMPPFMRKGK